MMNPLTHVDTGIHTLTYTVKHTWHVHDIHMDMNVKEEHVKMANLQQKKTHKLMWVVIAPQAVKSQQYEHRCEVVHCEWWN